VLQCSIPAPPPTLPSTVPASYECVAGRTSFDNTACGCHDPNCLMCRVNRALLNGSRCLVCTNSYYLTALGQCASTCSLSVQGQTAPNGRKCIAQAPSSTPPTVLGFCTNGRQGDGNTCQCLTNCLSCAIMSDQSRPCQTCTGFAFLHANSCVATCPSESTGGLQLRAVARSDGIGGLCRAITSAVATSQAPSTTTQVAQSSGPSVPECYGRTLRNANSTGLCSCGNSCYWCQVDAQGTNVGCLECYNSTYLHQGACVSHCNSGKTCVAPLLDLDFASNVYSRDLACMHGAVSLSDP
jgi:hypothetical protein